MPFLSFPKQALIFRKLPRHLAVVQLHPSSVSVAFSEYQLATPILSILFLLLQFQRLHSHHGIPGSQELSSWGFLSSGGQELKACTGHPRPPGGSVHTRRTAREAQTEEGKMPDLGRRCRRAQGHVLAPDQPRSMQDPACNKVWLQASDTQSVPLTSGPLCYVILAVCDQTLSMAGSLAVCIPYKALLFRGVKDPWPCM